MNAINYRYRPPTNIKECPTPDEAALTLRAQKGDVGALKALIQYCLPAIKKTAKVYKHPRITFDELVHEGTVAIWERVVRHYDPQRSGSFQGFLGRCLDSAMLDYANSTKPRSINRDVKTALAYLIDEMRRFKNEHGRKMTDEELVTFFNRDSDKECTIDDVNRILEFGRPNFFTTSLSDPLHEDSDESRQDRLASKAPLPDKRAELREEAVIIREKARRAAECFGARNRDIYLTYMGLGPSHRELTMREIEKLYDISYQRVGQIVKKCHQHVVAVLKYDPVIKEMGENLT